MDFLVVEDDITNLQVDALVNAVNSSLLLEHGVARAVGEAAGEAIQIELLDKAPAELTGGEVIHTNGYDLFATHVLHAVAVPLPSGSSEQSIRTATVNALKKADELGCSSIALPALGCGISSYPLREGARFICEEILNFDGQNLEEALLVGYSADEHEILRSVAWEVRSETTAR